MKTWQKPTLTTVTEQELNAVIMVSACSHNSCEGGVSISYSATLPLNVGPAQK